MTDTITQSLEELRVAKERLEDVRMALVQAGAYAEHPDPYLDTAFTTVQDAIERQRREWFAAHVESWTDQQVLAQYEACDEHDDPNVHVLEGEIKRRGLWDDDEPMDDGGRPSPEDQQLVDEAHRLGGVHDGSLQANVQEQLAARRAQARQVRLEEGAHGLELVGAEVKALLNHTEMTDERLLVSINDAQRFVTMLRKALGHRAGAPDCRYRRRPEDHPGRRGMDGAHDPRHRDVSPWRGATEPPRVS